MSAVNEAQMARASLRQLERLLEEAAEKRLGVEEVLDEALAHLGEARAILETVGDDEGTE